jgi:hypothetical protein
LYINKESGGGGGRLIRANKSVEQELYKQEKCVILMRYLKRRREGIYIEYGELTVELDSDGN